MSEERIEINYCGNIYRMLPYQIQLCIDSPCRCGGCVGCVAVQQLKDQGDSDVLSRYDLSGR